MSGGLDKYFHSFVYSNSLLISAPRLIALSFSLTFRNLRIIGALAVCFFLAFSLAACQGETIEGQLTPQPTLTGAAVTPSPAPTATPTELPVAPEPQPGDTATPEEEQVSLPDSPAETSPVSFVTEIPDPDRYELRQVFSGLNSPVGLAHAGDGSGRLFILEQAGVIRVVQGGQLLPDPFLDIRDRVGSRASEQGLLGLAFHPRFAENGYFYVHYTDSRGHTVISRFNTSEANQADPQSEVFVLQQTQPYANHNGGMIVFGPDGYLYIGLGDGGSGGDPLGNAQSLDTLLGKLLRIDVDGGQPYAIPADNPFAAGGGAPEIWAYGLRNPWRFSFDRLTGDLYIGDVGQSSREEINFLPAGSPGGVNFGWNYREGTQPYAGEPPAGVELVDPVTEYGRSEGISVTGGFVYRGQDLPEWQGVYLYGDYGSGRVWGLLRNPDGTWQDALLFESGARITSFGEDEAGELYLVGHQGTLYQLVER